MKPDNILFKYSGGFKLTDFGASTQNGSKLKTTVNFRKTVYYASIEQLNLENKDLSFPYFDVWSLGIIAYQMMSGDVPYKAAITKIIKEIKRK